MIRKKTLQSRIEVLERQVDNLQTSNRSRDITASLLHAQEAQRRSNEAAMRAAERPPYWIEAMKWQGVPRCRCCGNLASVGRESCSYCFAHCRYALRPTPLSGGWTHTPPPPWGPPSCDSGVHTDASGRVCGGVHHYEPCQKCGRVNWTRTPTCGCGDPACGRYR